MKAQGFVLMLVIAILLLVSMLAASFSAHLQVETRSTSWLSEQAHLKATAQAAIFRALLGVSSKNKQQRWLADGRTYHFNWEGKPVRIQIRSESGKIDLNLAPRALLLGLFEQTLPQHNANTLADRLADWLDHDDIPLPQGAEAKAYQRAGLTHRPSNGPLHSIDELSQVLGFDHHMLEKLRPHISIYARRPRIDVTAATAQVIAALPGIEQSLARQFVQQRENAIQSNEQIDISLLQGVQQYIDSSGSHQVVSITAEINNNHGQTYKEQAIIRLQLRQGSGYRILSWQH